MFSRPPPESRRPGPFGSKRSHKMIVTLRLLPVFVSVFIAADPITSRIVSCPITDEHTMVYSVASGVGPASQLWVEDFLWWWKNTDPSVQYTSLSGAETQVCDLASFPNLKVFMNPGGDAYDQLSSLGATGRQNIIDFINRGDSGYVGFCAGGYIASHDYLWESMYEGPGYYNFAVDPPLSVFPHTVEGSLTDINDDQFADQSGEGVDYRLVNVSNGQKMLYYGGSSFGWNGSPAYHDAADPEHDSKVDVLLYFTDFFGFKTFNLPAVWRYGNLLLTSVHPEADNCTTYDCPVAGTIPDDMVLTNRAWLATHVNTVAGTSFSVPAVAPAPSFNTTPPHTEYPNKDCYAAGHNSSSPTNGEVLFCDDFDASLGTVASGLWQWQRNKTTYDQPAPWNTTFLSEWFGNEYGGAFAGNGYAVCVPKAPTSQSATIESRPFAVPATGASLAFSYKGQTLTGGSFKVDYGAPGSGENDGDWTELQAGPLNQGAEWAEAAYQLSGGSSESTMTSVRFTCSGGSADTNFCAVDSVVISA